MRESVMITGASCTGKSMVINSLVENARFVRVPGFTTRAPRRGEISGFDYLYISEKEFRDKFNRGDFVDPDFSVTEYGGQFYGSPREWIDLPIAGHSILFSLTSTVTANNVKQILDERIIWAHLFADERARRSRLMIRGVSSEEVKNRLLNGDSHGIMDSADLNLNTSELGTKDVVQIVLEKVRMGGG